MKYKIRTSVRNNLVGTKSGLKNAALFRTENAVTFEPDIPHESKWVLSIAWVMTIP